MIKAAGVLILDAGDCALFLKRGPSGDSPGVWCFPGGKQEGDESLEQTAIRETAEETGFKPDSKTLKYLVRTKTRQDDPAVGTGEPIPAPTAEDVDYTTFSIRVKDRFEPKPDAEHSGYAWAPISDPPQPLHPGCQKVLRRLSMTTETELAQAIASGEFASPQQFGNSWYFAMRITATGAAYRTAHDEYVWRDPSIYMNAEFLARCNGLPVILLHPDEATLNTEEYKRRNIGSIVLPYLKPESNEVWGIARIIDEPAARLMEEKRLSTSPAVVFHDPDVNTKLEDEDGKTILIEGKPSLLDHLAVCEQGVWDKGGSPRGIESATVKDVTMADEDKRAADDKARKDMEETRKADAEKFDKLLTGIDAVCAKMGDMEKRMDAYESLYDKKADKRKDEEEKSEKEDDEDETEEKKADKARKDEEEEKKDGEDPDDLPVAADKARKDLSDKPNKEVMYDKRKDMQTDKARKDAQLSSILNDVDELKKRMKPVTDADRKAFASAQERADSAFTAFGDSAPPPMQGEDLLDYRIRLLGKVQDHSAVWRGREIGSLVRADAAKPAKDQKPLIDIVESQIYADAVQAAESPARIEAGKEVEIVRRDSSGRQISTFRGQRSFVRQFTLPARHVGSFSTPNNNNNSR